MKTDPFAKIGAKLAAARAPIAAPKRPPGAFTAAEYAKRFEVSKDVARSELSKLVERGKLNGTMGSRGRPAYYTFNE